LAAEKGVRPEATANKAQAESGQAAGRAPGVISCTIHGLLSGGRAGAKLTHIKDEADFEQRILRADRPAVVVFYKGGCPTCLLLHPSLRQLAEEYTGRVLFAGFELMKPYFVVTAREVRQRYRIAYYPTVILFVGGQERKRWTLNYRLASYRKALDKVLAEPPTDRLR
jgi:thioredoxin 1